MKASASEFQTVDSYIGSFPKDIEAILRRIRIAIKAVVPEASETIRYGIPTFMLNGTYLVYFAAYKKHVSVYPIPHGDAALARAMKPHMAGAGTLRFPLDKPIPYALITRVVKALRKTNASRAAKSKRTLR